MSEQSPNNQQQVWNAIAEEWHKFKVKDEKINKKTAEFLSKQKGNILDLGSGSGRYLQKIKNGKMYLVDFSKEMIKLAKKKAKKEKIPAEFFISSMTKLPFEDNFFNAAIANSSFHCLNKKEQIQAAKELFRVLKPKAKAEISVWNIESKRFKNAKKEKYIGWRDKGKRYYYLFNPKEIYDLFEKTGFKILEKQTPGIMISFIVEKN
jgi:ubiquinone/menaquinone biosynthesis C-methylase UbiE